MLHQLNCFILLFQGDPYVTLSLTGNVNEEKTTTKWNDDTPNWNEFFYFLIYPENPTLSLRVRDNDFGRDAEVYI